MRKKEPKGLLAAWTDIDHDYRTEFVKWHNCEHIPERVSIPGFHVGHRYRGIGSAPDFMLLYETSDSQVLKNEAYLHYLNNPTLWTQQTLPHFKNFSRTIYSLLASAGKRPLLDAPYVLACKFDCQPGEEKEIIKWFRNEYLPQSSKISGVNRIRIYENLPDLSSIQTEQTTFEAGPTRQCFLILFEISSLDLVTNIVSEEIHIGIDESKALQEHIRQERIKNIKQESYWHHFTMYAPKAKRSTV